jgi:hypothetical protein
MKFFTIGYGGQSPDEFLGLCRKPIDYPQFVEIIEKYLKPISCGITLPE